MCSFKKLVQISTFTPSYYLACFRKSDVATKARKPFANVACITRHKLVLRLWVLCSFHVMHEAEMLHIHPEEVRTYTLLTKNKRPVWEYISPQNVMTMRKKKTQGRQSPSKIPSKLGRKLLHDVMIELLSCQNSTRSNINILT